MLHLPELEFTFCNHKSALACSAIFTLPCRDLFFVKDHVGLFH